jgi:hypothetical protein
LEPSLIIVAFVGNSKAAKGPKGSKGGEKAGKGSSGKGKSGKGNSGKGKSGKGKAKATSESGEYNINFRC